MIDLRVASSCFTNTSPSFCNYIAVPSSMSCMSPLTLFYLQERERVERVQKESLSREWDRAVERSSGASGAIPKGQMYIKKK